MDTCNPHTASPAMANALRASADATGMLSFAGFSAVALFAPQIGYYTSQRQRVGLNDASDFYTASSVGPVFGQLVAEAAATAIAPAQPQDFALVEIGAERGNGVFQQLLASAHTTEIAPENAATPAATSATGSTAPSNNNYIFPPFAQTLTLPIGEEWAWPQKAVIFANELLDAQPFHRLQYLEGRWREWGVRCEDNGTLHEVLLPDFSPEVAAHLAADLSINMPEGYRLDISLAAEALLRDLLSRNWQGAFLLFDYGRNWQELLSNCPAGTARAYRSHRLTTDLLANPGEQDLTCHVCWDRLEKIAIEHGFKSPRLDRQESFFMRYSQQSIARIISKAPERFDPDRQALMSLLHPTHLGSKFQVLHGVRGG